MFPPAPHVWKANVMLRAHLVSSLQFEEVIMSEESAELVGDGFSEVAAAIVADYDAGEMPMPGTEEFAPVFKKWIKVQSSPTSGCSPAHGSLTYKDLWSYRDNSI